MADEGKNSGSHVVHLASEVAKEIPAWELRVAEKDEELSELSLHIQNMKIELHLFLGEYNSRVGSLYVEFDKLRLRIHEYQLRIDRVQNRKVSQDSLKNIETEVHETFTEEREDVDELEREASNSYDAYRDSQTGEEEGIVLDGEIQEELKKLYRKLARKFHPDFAKDGVQRDSLNKIMAIINEAYKNADLETLRKYMKQAEREAKIAKETPGEKLSRLKEDYTTLLSVIAKLRAELEDLEASETYKLSEKVKQAKKQGRDLLQELAASIQEDVDENQTLLDKLVSQYKTILASVGF